MYFLIPSCGDNELLDTYCRPTLHGAGLCGGNSGARETRGPSLREDDLTPTAGLHFQAPRSLTLQVLAKHSVAAHQEVTGQSYYADAAPVLVRQDC